jgi:c(7)-type cytochrome triheme protein
MPPVLAQAAAGEAPASTAAQGEAPPASANTASDSVAEAEEAEEFVGEMYQIGLGWHPAGLEGLPTDKFGLVDWVAALEQGLIKPRSNIDPKGPEGVPFDMNIVMPSKTGMIAGAYFPHKTHTTWMSCDSCHVKIFMPLAGSNDLTMSTIANGQACGVCHGKVAFPLNDCTRCHISHADADGTAGQ